MRHYYGGPKQFTSMESAERAKDTLEWRGMLRSDEVRRFIAFCTSIVAESSRHQIDYLLEENRILKRLEPRDRPHLGGELRIQSGDATAAGQSPGLGVAIDRPSHPRIESEA